MRILLPSLTLAIAIGCGGAPDAARHAVAIASAGLLAADAVSSPVYAAKAAECYDSSETAAEYRACVSRVDALEAALRTGRAAMLATETGLDAWDAGTDEGATFADAIPCAAQALAAVVTLLADIGLDVPDDVARAVGLAAAFGGRCTP